MPRMWAGGFLFLVGLTSSLLSASAQDPRPEEQALSEYTSSQLPELNLAKIAASPRILDELYQPNETLTVTTDSGEVSITRFRLRNVEIARVSESIPAVGYLLCSRDENR